MTESGKKRIRRITAVYWVLLFYIIAALVWWFISLENQNVAMADLKMTQLKQKTQGINDSGVYQTELNKIIRERRRNNTKYVSEGITFFILILVGAGFVYRSVRKQFKVQLQQENFMMAVTHELKTPISVARLNLETLQKYTLDAEKQKKLIKMTLQETNRLNTLTNNILVSSQLDGGGFKFSKEELDLSDLLKDCVHDYKNRYPERTFYEHIQPDMDVKGDPLLLQMMINNLLENAIKYSGKETPVSCILKNENGSIQLSIIDEGIGIPENERKNIFNKFYRIGNEATRKTQGTGLGLYLCRKIAKDHNADISVTNRKGGGSIFTITFEN
jgi:two-component system, OmpR family, sensor histidine kinase CiaH